MKQFHIHSNIGKAKYLVNYHDGIKLHKDGSLFFDIEIFKNKKDLNNFTKSLINEGYINKR